MPSKPRPRAGRIPNAKKHAKPIKSFTDEAAAFLPEAIDLLKGLGRGSHRVRRQAAGTIFRKDVDRMKDGTPRMDGKGKPIPIEVLAFPHLPPDEMVVIESIDLPPDFRSLEYIGDRSMGRPTQAVELGGEDGGPMQIEVAFKRAIERIYGETAGKEGE